MIGNSKVFMGAELRARGPQQTFRIMVAYESEAAVDF
jgi:hypothetical protein